MRRDDVNIFRQEMKGVGNYIFFQNRERIIEENISVFTSNERRDEVNTIFNVIRVNDQKRKHMICLRNKIRE